MESFAGSLLTNKFAYYDVAGLDRRAVLERRETQHHASACAIKSPEVIIIPLFVIWKQRESRAHNITITCNTMVVSLNSIQVVSGIVRGQAPYFVSELYRGASNESKELLDAKLVEVTVSIGFLVLL